MTVEVKTYSIIQKLLTAVLILVFLSNGCEAQSGKEIKETKEIVKAKVTFVELGSVNCIPCKQMQPVMKAIEEKYGEQIKVVFYDVWKEDQKKYGQEYGIRLIPTQVFLDENGKEFHRHEGFYPEAEIDKVLQGKGLKAKG
ncbi:MAG: thioredoxin family protein [Bacteroidetes bacterium]|nr:thioredoxin family protein [Bacteroidota bacterium]